MKEYDLLERIMKIEGIKVSAKIILYMTVKLLNEKDYISNKELSEVSGFTIENTRKLLRELEEEKLIQRLYDIEFDFTKEKRKILLTIKTKKILKQ